MMNKIISLDISNRNLTTLEGIEFPENITELYCQYNQLTSIKGCPKTVTCLLCNDNLLTNFKYFPRNLTYLNISNNPIKTLKGCPKKLVSLHSNETKISSLKYCPRVLVLLCAKSEVRSLKYCPSTITYIYWDIHNLCKYLKGPLMKKYSKGPFKVPGHDYHIYYMYNKYTTKIKPIFINKNFNISYTLKLLKINYKLKKLWDYYWCDELIYDNVNRLCIFDFF